MYIYKVRPRKDHRGVDLISNTLNFSGFFMLDRSLALRLNGPWGYLGEDSS
jgi:hypothetical protein